MAFYKITRDTLGRPVVMVDGKLQLGAQGAKYTKDANLLVMTLHPASERPVVRRKSKGQ